MENIATIWSRAVKRRSMPLPSTWLVAVMFGSPATAGSHGFALTPYVGKPLQSSAVPQLCFDSRAGLLCPGCQHLSAESEVRTERQRGGRVRDREKSQAKGNERESWHFQTLSSVEPFRGFNVIFGLWNCALFLFLNKKAAEGRAWQTKEGI